MRAVRARKFPVETRFAHAGLAKPFHRDGTKRLDLDVPLAEADRVGGEQRRPGPRELLHPGREVRRLADGGVVQVEIAADRAYHHLARVEAHADLDIEPVGAPEFASLACSC